MWSKSVEGFPPLSIVLEEPWPKIPPLTWDLDMQTWRKNKCIQLKRAVNEGTLAHLGTWMVLYVSGSTFVTPNLRTPDQLVETSVNRIQTFSFTETGLQWSDLIKYFDLIKNRRTDLKKQVLCKNFPFVAPLYHLNASDLVGLFTDV